MPNATKAALLQKSKRWARQMCREQYRPGKKKCYRLMMSALKAALSPAPDGGHPLDHKHFELEG